MRIITLPIIIMLFFATTSFGQPIGMPYSAARLEKMDELKKYTDAIATATTPGIFKTDEEIETLIIEFTKLRQDLGNFLYDQGFRWRERTRCFNKVYFKKDGSIDYFLYSLRSGDENPLSEEEKMEFNRLLNLFIQDYKFGITADENFTQCGSSLYAPVAENKETE